MVVSESKRKRESATDISDVIEAADFDKSYKDPALIQRRYRRRMKTSRLAVCIVLTGTVSLLAEDKVAEKLKPALDVITPDALLSHIKILASDEFEGRGPGSKGEELSVKYISDQFKALGLKPGPRVGEILKAVYEQQMDGTVASLDQAIAAAKTHLDAESSS